MKKNVGIVIVDYYGLADTLECLNSILKCSLNDDLVIRVYVVDNSTEGLLEVDKLPSGLKCKLIANSMNRGFAGGNNDGIKSALLEGCEWIALINNDTVFVDDSLMRAVSFLGESSSYGICGLRNYYFDRPDELWQSGFRNCPKRATQFGVNPKDSPFEGIVDVDYVPGSSMIVNAEVFNKIGLLNEDYFAYYEENDFCMRARSAGFKTCYLYDSKILHKVGRSSGGLLKFYLRSRNSNLFWRRNGSYYNVMMNSVRFFLRANKLMLNYKEWKYLMVYLWAQLDYLNGRLGSYRVKDIFKL